MSLFSLVLAIALVVGGSGFGHMETPKDANKPAVAAPAPTLTDTDKLAIRTAQNKLQETQLKMREIQVNFGELQAQWKDAQAAQTDAAATLQRTIDAIYSGHSIKRPDYNLDPDLNLVPVKGGPNIDPDAGVKTLFPPKH